MARPRLVAAQARLEAERAETLSEIEALTKARQDIIDAASLVATDDEHDPEGSTIAFEREQLTALLDQANRQMSSLDGALKRIRTGTYGICMSCGQAIPTERLEVRPAASTCVRCASG